MKYSISLDFKYLSIKMNWEKLIFHWEKWNFKPTANSVHTTKIVALGKALLATITHKISETNSSFQMKQRTTGKF